MLCNFSDTGNAGEEGESTSEKGFHRSWEGQRLYQSKEQKGYEFYDKRWEYWNIMMWVNLLTCS